MSEKPQLSLVACSQMHSLSRGGQKSYACSKGLSFSLEAHSLFHTLP